GRFFRYAEERDPNITEAFDFPWLTYNGSGLLPQDRTHTLKVTGSYETSGGTTLGGSLNAASGTPLSATTDPEGGTTPFYGGLNLVKRGTADRTSPLFNLDLKWSHRWELGKGVALGLYADVFNALNLQTVTNSDQYYMQAGTGRNLVC